MKKIINFIKEYTLKDMITDIKYFGGITMFISIAYVGYIILYNILKYKI